MTFREFLGTNVIPRENLDIAWARTGRWLASSSRPYNLVSSILSDIINTLLSAKWTPYSIDLWIDPRGTHWKLGTTILPPSSIVAAAIIQDLHNN